MAHHHDHHHQTENIQTAFWLNLGFTLVEIIGGFFSNSIAILADALHDLGDSLALGLAWYFQKKANQKKDSVFNYGYGRFSLVGALINALILLIGSVFVIYQTITRLFNPEVSDAKLMFMMAILGIIVNGIAVLKLKKGESLNERVVMLHLLEDVLGWVAVLIGSIVLYFTNWLWIDPLLSLGISLFILFNIYQNLKSVFRVILQGIPDSFDTLHLEKEIKALEDVEDLHDFRLWSTDGQHGVVSVHVVLNETAQTAKVKEKIKSLLSKFEIIHATIETEFKNESCMTNQ